MLFHSIIFKRQTPLSERLSLHLHQKLFRWINSQLEIRKIYFFKIMALAIYYNIALVSQQFSYKGNRRSTGTHIQQYKIQKACGRQRWREMPYWFMSHYVTSCSSHPFKGQKQTGTSCTAVVCDLIQLHEATLFIQCHVLCVEQHSDTTVKAFTMRRFEKWRSISLSLCSYLTWPLNSVRGADGKIKQTQQAAFYL